MFGRRAEELIIANKKAEESNRLKTAFLANLSHEIRTPMNGILEFFVKDTGIGISQEMKTMIFERFRHADETYSRNYEGLGLGLSIAKSYVEMIGGKIWVDSQEGEGSVFYFTIPYVAGKEEEVIYKESMFTDSPDHHIKKLKILVAEDEEISDLLITLMLEIFGHEMFHAKDGIEAVELCKTNPDIDLVLMDIKMPRMNGLDATREIRQFNKDVIIIAQTAQAYSGEKAKTSDAGYNDYITKPINKGLFNELIQECFKNK